MKLVIQRVSRAKVVGVESGKTFGEIGEGLFILVGFKKGDSEKDVETLAEKVSKLRVMRDLENKMNLSVVDTKSKILVVSQFTLYANTNDGNRPSFFEAEEPNHARELYNLFIKKLGEKDIWVESGSFGDYMQIEAVMDGPVTILM